LALVMAGLAATAAIVKLARVGAVATRDRVDAPRRDPVSQLRNGLIADRPMSHRGRPKTHYNASTVSGQR
jgi:hypothetical protein